MLAPSQEIKLGTRLLREWNGTTTRSWRQTIDVSNGTTYRSLTAISRTITGTPRIGPLFFGLKKKRAAKDG